MILLVKYDNFLNTFMERLWVMNMDLAEVLLVLGHLNRRHLKNTLVSEVYSLI